MVDVRVGSIYINIDIRPSILDRYHTKGLCGSFNGNINDDFEVDGVLKDVTTFTTEMRYLHNYA